MPSLSGSPAALAGAAWLAGAPVEADTGFARSAATANAALTTAPAAPRYRWQEMRSFMTLPSYILIAQHFAFQVLEQDLIDQRGQNRNGQNVRHHAQHVGGFARIGQVAAQA